LSDRAPGSGIALHEQNFPALVDNNSVEVLTAL
jgi:hypothetical protein